MKNKTSKYILSAVLFLVFLALFFYLNFPTESLKKRIVAEIENSTDYTVEIEDVDFSPLAVIRLKNLNLKNDDRQVDILIDRLSISPSLLSVFLQSKKIPFTAEIEKGEIDGVIVYSKNVNKLTSVRASLDNVNPGIINKFLKNKKGLPVFGGNVSGEIDVELVKDGVDNINGEFDLYSENFSLSNMRVESFTLPNYQGLKAALQGKIKKNTTQLSKLQLENDDFNLILNGTMPPLWKMRRGMLDLSVNLVLNSNEAKMGFLQAFMKKGNDGTLSAKIGGTFNKPQFIKGGTL